MDNDNNVIWIASFDIGKNNFAFYIEEVNTELFQNIKNVDISERYNNDGTTTDVMSAILNDVYTNGKTVTYVNEDLNTGLNKEKYLDVDVYYNMNALLDKYISYFNRCKYILIEKQMKKNTMAMKLGQHCFSFFTIKLSRNIRIIEFSSYHKTQILGAEKTFEKKYKNGNIKWKTMDPRTRKKWAVTKGLEILSLRKEDEIVKDLLERKTTKKKGVRKIKLDDIMDNKLMIEAFKFLHFIDKKDLF